MESTVALESMVKRKEIVLGDGVKEFILENGITDAQLNHSLIDESVKRLLLKRGVDYNLPIYYSTQNGETVKTTPYEVLYRVLDERHEMTIIIPSLNPTPIAMFRNCKGNLAVSPSGELKPFWNYEPSRISNYTGRN